MKKACVAGARLAEDEVVRAEELPERASAHGVHRARLEVHEDRARDVAAARGLVEVHVDALELQVRVAVVRTRRVDAVLVRDHLREEIRRSRNGERSRRCLSNPYEQANFES